MSDTMGSLNRKITSAGDLQSVVRTMKALAASSIGQYEKSVVALADYYRAVELGLGACLRESGAVDTPPDGKMESGMIGAIVFGSDQGLVGQFNEAVADFAISKLAVSSENLQVWAVGERVHDRLADAGLTMIGLYPVPNSVEAIAPLVGQIQVESLEQGEGARNPSLWLFYNQPEGSTYEPVCQKLLPLDAAWQRQLAGIVWPTKCLTEVFGTGASTLRSLIREYLFISLFRACAESLASENASRLAAMERAERNIDEMLEILRRDFHRLRQSSIDEELFDLISGYEALGKSRS